MSEFERKQLRWTRITAIFTIYDDTYQLVLNTHEDVVVK